MNILPKKRWHVRTKDNIERVRRDEAKAAEDEKERQRKIQLAEQEARTSLLRNQAQKKKLVDKPNAESSSALVKVDKPEHVNLFQANQDGQKSWGKNKEHEEEKKQEQEKLEQSIGLLTYLGQGAGDKPWYSEPRAKRQKGAPQETEEVNLKSKLFLDPLKDLKKYTDGKHHRSPVEAPKKPPLVTRTAALIIPDSYQLAKRSLEKERTKHKKQKKKHKKHKDKDKSKISLHKSSTSSIEQLRAARLAREMEERKRAELLLAKMRGEVTEEKPPSPVQDGKQRYNSQFNPHIAKQYKMNE